jgi:hypothetical protein
MASKNEAEWSASFQRRPRLTPEQAQRVVALRQRLTEQRYLSFEYLLRRATSSGTKSEQVAWWSVWAVQVFVEHQHRFPRKGELYPYLHKILDESKTLEGLKLPPLESLPGEGPREAQRTSMESLQHEVSSLRKKLQSANREVQTAYSNVVDSISQFESGQAESLSLDPNNLQSLLAKLLSLTSV